MFSVFAQGIVVNAADESSPQGVSELAQENPQDDQIVQEDHSAQNEQAVLEETVKKAQIEQEPQEPKSSTPKTAKDLLLPKNSIKTPLVQTGDGEETPWSLGLCFYDSTVNNSQTPLYNIDWDATKINANGEGYDELPGRNITMNIYYQSNTATYYQPGELKISVPNLVYDYNSIFDFSDKYNLNIWIKAAANYENNVGHEWNFYGEEDGKNYSCPSIRQKNLVFTNNEIIGGKDFNGNLEIVFSITPAREDEGSSQSGKIEKYDDECTHSLNYEGRATLKKNDDSQTLLGISSNDNNEDPDDKNVHFNYTRTYYHPWTIRNYNLNKEAHTIDTAGEIVENPLDYYWVKFDFSVSSSREYPNRRNEIRAKSMYVLDSFPKNCRVFTTEGKEITKNDNEGENEEYSFNISFEENSNRIAYKTSAVIVAYPKEYYNLENNNTEFNNTAYLHGTRENNSTFSSDDTVPINLVEFAFTYPEGYYHIDKQNYNTTYEKLYYEDIVKNGEDLNHNYAVWRLYPTARYISGKMDIEFGDDVLYYKNHKAQILKLEDEDYSFRSIGLSSSWKNILGGTIPTGKYDIELYIRRASQTSASTLSPAQPLNYTEYNGYELYDSFKNGMRGEKADSIGVWNFTKADHVVGYFFVIKDMIESLNCNSVAKNSCYSTCKTEFYMKDKSEDDNKGISTTGTVYNCSYINAYKALPSGEKVIDNLPDITSYKDYAAKDLLNFDIANYGAYRMRDVQAADWVDANKPIDCIHRIMKEMSIKDQNESEKCHTGNNRIVFTIGGGLYEEGYDEFYRPEDMINYFAFYDLLPKGMDVYTDQDNLATFEDSLRSKIIFYMDYYDTDKIFDKDFQEISYEEFIDILKDRCEIKVTPDWKQTGRTHIAVRFNLEDTPVYLFAWPGGYLDIPISVSYDNCIKYGYTYTNRVYSEALYTGSREGRDSKRVPTDNRTCSDDGLLDPQEFDINETGGVVEDNFCLYQSQATIIYADSSHQSLSKGVKTPNTTDYKYKQATAKPGEEYSYQLCINTGSAKLTDLIVYDSIERYVRDEDGNFISAVSKVGENENNCWYGTFEGVDLSDSIGRNYKIRVWYSTSEQPGKLHEDNSWTDKLDEVTKEDVHSLAFEYVDLSDDTKPAKLKEKTASFLKIIMKAPPVGYETRTAYNGSYCDFTPLGYDETGIDFINKLDSNIVKVSLSDTTTFDVTKKWFFNETNPMPQSPLPSDPVPAIPVSAISNRRNLVPQGVGSIPELPESIFIQLKRNGENYGDPVQLTAENESPNSSWWSYGSEWKYTFTDLPKYDNDGNLYTYSVAELPIEGYFSYVTQEEGSNKATITNVTTTDAKVKKIWRDDNNKNNTRPQSIVVQLCQNTGNGATEVEGKTLRLSAANNWSGQIEGLAAYTKTGEKIEYSFIEKDCPENYTPTYFLDTSQDVFTIINTIYEYISIPVEKKWIGTPAKGVLVELIADRIILSGNVYNDFLVDEIVLSADNNWKHTFENLEKYDSNGVEIQYTVREVDADKYFAKISGNMNDGFVITNISPKTLNIPVEKKWIGPKAEAITIKLLADNEEIDSVNLNESNSWKHTFKDLRKYDSNDGHEIKYTITEDTLDGYKTSITGDTQKGFVVTNTKITPPPINPPKTSDESHMLFYLLTMILSGVGLVFALLFGRKLVQIHIT